MNNILQNSIIRKSIAYASYEKKINIDRYQIPNIWKKNIYIIIYKI